MQNDPMQWLVISRVTLYMYSILFVPTELNTSTWEQPRFSKEDMETMIARLVKIIEIN